MSDSELIIDISVDASSAHKELPRTRNEIKDVGDEAENTDKRGRGLGGMFDLLGKGALIAGGGILALGGFLVGAAKAASDEQVGMDRLYGTVKNSIAGWDGNTAAIEKHISSMERLAFSDDEARDSLNFLVGQTKDLKEAQELQATAADLARAKGIDLMTATKAVGKVDNESIGILKKLGIEVTDQMTKEEALAAIRKTTAGQAETYANSAAGSMSRLQTSLGNAFETIGGAVLNLVSGPLQAIADWFSSEEVQAGIQTVATFIGTTLTNAFTFLGQVVNTAWGIIKPFVDNFVNFISTIANGGDPFAAFGTYIGNLVKLIGDAVPGIAAKLLEWGTAFATWVWQDAIPKLGVELGKLIQGLWTWITTNGPTILAQLGVWTTAFLTWVWNDAIPFTLKALGDLIAGILKWIGDNGPGILAKLGEWTTAFLQWVWNDAIPFLLSALGDLISTVWNWITTNGPTILAKLGEWTMQFLSWVWNDVLPKLPGWLWNIISAVWNWITTNAPSILEKLWSWAVAFWDWIIKDVVPNLGGWLANIAVALWTWISQTGRDMPAKLGEWSVAFWSWVTGKGGVIETVGPTMDKFWFGLGSWIVKTSQEIITTIGLAWIPAFWSWLTGSGGVIATLSTELNKIIKGIGDWVTGSISTFMAKAGPIGKGILDGITAGIVANWNAFTIWIQGKVWSIITSILSKLGISSPSTVARDQIGKPLVQGIQQGFDDEYLVLRNHVVQQIGDLTTRLNNIVKGAPVKQIGMDLPTTIDKGRQETCPEVSAGLESCVNSAIDAGEAAASSPKAKTPGQMMAWAVKNGIIDEQDQVYGAMNAFWNGLWGIASKRAQEIQDLINETFKHGYTNNDTGGTGGGGGGGKTQGLMGGGGGIGGGGFIFGGGSGGSGGTGGIEVNVYLDGIRMSAGQLAEQMGLDLRVTTART